MCVHIYYFEPQSYSKETQPNEKPTAKKPTKFHTRKAHVTIEAALDYSF